MEAAAPARNGPVEGEPMSTRTTNEPNRPHRHRTLRSLTVMPALAGLTALGLSACTVTPAEETPQSPTTATSSATEGASPSGSAGESTDSPSASGSASPSGTEAEATSTPLSLDQLSDALLEEADFPVAGAVAREDSRVENVPFTMYVNLNGFTPEGACAAALEKVNSFEAPQSTAVAATYETDLEPADGGDKPPTVQFMAVATQTPLDAMAVYSEIPEACGTLEGDQAAGATAVFEPFELGTDGEASEASADSAGSADSADSAALEALDAVDAMQLQIDSGNGQAQTMVIGGISEGRNHLYTVMSLVDPEDARQILTAQAERFLAALEQQDS